MIRRFDASSCQLRPRWLVTVAIGVALAAIVLTDYGDIVTLLAFATVVGWGRRKGVIFLAPGKLFIGGRSARELPLSAVRAVVVRQVGWLDFWPRNLIERFTKRLHQFPTEVLLRTRGSELVVTFDHAEDARRFAAAIQSG